MEKLLKRVDHLVLAVPDLIEGIQAVHELTGARPQIGGQHMGRGTWNALLSLGRDSYLELIAPDPKQEVPEDGYWMGLENVTEPKLIHWAAKVNPIDEIIDKAIRNNLTLGKLSAGSRTRMSSQVISWMLTEPVEGPDGGLLPFLIDWEDSDHPAESLPQQCRLIHLEGMHPDPEWIHQQLAILDISMPVTLGIRPQIMATLQTPKGKVCFL